MTKDVNQNYELGRLAAEIEAASAENRRYRAKDYWTPYPKQSQFFATGLRFRERGLFAGTQLGKTESAAYEMACHLPANTRRTGRAGNSISLFAPGRSAIRSRWCAISARKNCAASLATSRPRGRA